MICSPNMASNDSIYVTRLTGAPALKALTFSTVARINRRLAARLPHAMCGVIRHLGADKRGLSPEIGSLETTSRAAPPI